MKHVNQNKTTELQIRTSDAFSRIGVAMENLLSVAPEFLKAEIVDGSKECHGKRKHTQKAA